MNQQSIRHHYIPKFYTGLWKSKFDGKITQFSKRNGTVIERRKRPIEVGFKDHLYTAEGFGPDNRSGIEDIFFKQVDLFGSQVVEYMLSNRKVPTDGLLRNKFSLFMTSLLHRTPDRVDEIKLGILGVANELIEKLRKDFKDGTASPEVTEESLAQSEMWMREDALNRAWGHSLMRATESEMVNTGLINMAWGIHFLPNGYDNLLTSDKPIVRSDGFAHSAGYISLALGPKVIFIATNNKMTLDNIMGSGVGKLIQNFNRAVCNQAIEYAYGSDNTQTFFVEEWLARHARPSF